MNKPFTELPAPKRTHRLAIVAVWNPINVYCEHPQCKWPDVEEVSECPVCGRWMCVTCGQWASGVTITLDKIINDHATDICCPDCSKLTNDERQAIMALREHLSH